MGLDHTHEYAIADVTMEAELNLWTQRANIMWLGRCTCCRQDCGTEKSRNVSGGEGRSLEHGDVRAIVRTEMETHHFLVDQWAKVAVPLTDVKVHFAAAAASSTAVQVRDVPSRHPPARKREGLPGRSRNGNSSTLKTNDSTRPVAAASRPHEPRAHRSTVHCGINEPLQGAVNPQEVLAIFNRVYQAGREGCGIDFGPQKVSDEPVYSASLGEAVDEPIEHGLDAATLYAE